MVQDFIFTCCFVWIWNLIIYTTGRTYIEGVLEQGAEDSIEPKRGEMVGSWWKLDSEKFHYFYALMDQIAEDEIGWAFSTRENDEKCVKKLIRNLKVIRHLEDLVVDGCIILE